MTNSLAVFYQKPLYPDARKVLGGAYKASYSSGHKTVDSLKRVNARGIIQTHGSDVKALYVCGYKQHNANKALQQGIMAKRVNNYR